MRDRDLGSNYLKIQERPFDFEMESQILRTFFDIVLEKNREERKDCKRFYEDYYKEELFKEMKFAIENFLTDLSD